MPSLEEVFGLLGGSPKHSVPLDPLDGVEDVP
jgi:hypothetical protein